MRFSNLLLSLSVVLLALGCWGKSTKTLTSTEVTPADAVPLKQGDGAPRPVIVDSVGRPLSFAPLVDRADPSVCTVKAIEVGREANGRVGPLTEGLGTA